MIWYKKAIIRKRAFLLASFILLLILSISLLAITGLNRVTEDVQSLFDDRLYPAVEMAQIIEKTYENRLLLEEYLYSELSNKEVYSLKQQIQNNTKKIDSLVGKYAATHLVEEEKKYLLNYQEEVMKYRYLEKEIIELYPSDEQSARELFSKDSSDEFKKLIEPLHRLTDLQLIIGKKLYEDSTREAKLLRVSFYIFMGVMLLAFILVAFWLSFFYMNEG
ncbi:MAG: MCP four helix bundle domain-containing protein [Thermonemataceae bacterium]|nr:MCP four helix bundle domain-containing protein [Thermonemataceae bacterium]